MANPSHDKGSAPMKDQRTYMTEEQAERWAWEQVKRDVGTEGWTAGDSCTYFGFFLWGWRYKGQYQRQRATPPSPSTAPEVDERAAFEAWKNSLGHESFGIRSVPNLPPAAWDAWQARAALASRPAEVDDEGLPGLPAPFMELHTETVRKAWAEQYRQGQRDAVAADRARRRQP